MELSRLIHPRPISLELSPDQEYVVIHNPDTFLNNGFTVAVDESRPLGSRVSLTSLPASKQYTFTVTDFMELVGLVMESGGVMVRPPKLAKLLASRACRMSVMVGDTLSYTKMVSVGDGKETQGQIVRSLAELDRPWSCPHG